MPRTRARPPRKIFRRGVKDPTPGGARRVVGPGFVPYSFLSAENCGGVDVYPPTLFGDCPQRESAKPTGGRGPPRADKLTPEGGRTRCRHLRFILFGNVVTPLAFGTYLGTGSALGYKYQFVPKARGPTTNDATKRAQTDQRRTTPRRNDG